MASVFVSYKHEDKEAASKIIDKIESAGHSVWWDDHINPREEWDDTIKRELESARAVVVLWTPASIKSKWVRTEAHYANERKKLIPVLVENCELPIAFLLNQTADLTQWRGGNDDVQWIKLMTWVEDQCAEPAMSNTSTEVENLPPSALSQWRDTYGESKNGEVIFDGTTLSQRTPSGTYFRDGDNLPLMCVIPQGSFTMGSPRNEEGRRDSEEPRHIVDFNQSVAIGVYPITYNDWDILVQFELVENIKENEEWARGEFPLVNVSWAQAQAFVTALSIHTKLPYRLLSEAEWEYACRAGTTTSFNCNSSISPIYANYDASRSHPTNIQTPSIGRTSEVGAYQANAFGLYDMHGNVREWVQDLWFDNYIDAPTDGLARLSGHSAMRVLRGGSWFDEEWFVRSAARGRGGESDRANFIGFRVARDI